MTRKTSLVTGKTNLEHLYTFKKFPVFIGCTDSPRSKDIRADMIFDICRDTGFIQLRKLLNPDLVYSSYHSEAVGGIWAQHHDQFCNFVRKFNPRTVIEIGGSNGYIAQKLTSIVSKSHVTMVEPNPAFPGNKRIKVIKAFFDDKFKLQENFDTMIHSHVWEHLYDPVAALSHMRDFLPVGAKLTFSIPNLRLWLKNKFPNTLNFEHTVYLTEEIADFLLSRHQFKILEKSYFQEHSIFYDAHKIKNPPRLAKLPNRYFENKREYLEFVKYYQDMVNNFNQKIASFPGPVYLFGAHIFSQMFVELDLKEKYITAILDDSQAKLGKRLYGSSLKVSNPQIISGQDKVAVILRAGAYTESVRSRLLAINPHTTIL